MSRSLTCTITGLVFGLPFTSKMRATARASSAVGAQSVNRFGGKGDEFAAAQKFGARGRSSSFDGVMDWSGFTIGCPSDYSVRPLDGSGESAESTSMWSPELGGTPGG